MSVSDTEANTVQLQNIGTSVNLELRTGGCLFERFGIVVTVTKHEMHRKIQVQDRFKVTDPGDVPGMDDAAEIFTSKENVGRFYEIRASVRIR